MKTRARKAVQPAIIGILTFIVGVVVTRELVTLGPQHPSFEGTSEWIYSVWMFMEAQYVPTTETVTSDSAANMMSETFIIESDSVSQYLQFLYVIPPTVLAAGGFISAARSKSRSIADGAIAGLMLTIGYFVACVSTLIFATESVSFGGANARVGPHAFDAMAISGLLFPLIFATLGGVIYVLTTGKIKISIRQT